MSSNIIIERVCELCGAVFTAQKTSTRYCSHKCSQRAYKKRMRNTKIEKSNVETSKAISLPLEQIKSKPYLNIVEACQLIGVCRKTLYNLIQRGDLKAGKFGDRVIIRREDIDVLLGKYLPDADRPDLNNYYTIKDVEAVHKIKYGRLREILDLTGIETTLYKRKLLIPQQALDSYFAEHSRNIDNIADWYDINEITTLYGINRDAIYRLAKQHEVPKKQIGRFVYLSRWHFDNLGLIETKNIQQYGQE